MLILIYSPPTKLCVYREYFSNILHYESAFWYEFSREEAPTLFLSFDWVNIGVLVELKPPISAVLAAWTTLRRAFCRCHPVEALLSTIEGLAGSIALIFLCRFLHALALNDKRLLVVELIPLPLQVLVFLERSELAEAVGEESEPLRVKFDL